MPCSFCVHQPNNNKFRGEGGETLEEREIEGGRRKNYVIVEKSAIPSFAKERTEEKGLVDWVGGWDVFENRYALSLGNRDI